MVGPPGSRPNGTTRSVVLPEVKQNKAEETNKEHSLKVRSRIE
jgi:hypothetical protein